MRILVIEDMESIAARIKIVLDRAEHQVTLCCSVEEVIRRGLVSNQDLVILDLMLPGKSGDFLISELRKERSNVAILVLSALKEVELKVDLLERGADDYLTKPFDASELLARVKALERRYLDVRMKEKEIFGDVTFFARENRMIREGQEILLTNKERQLLRILLENRGRIVRSEDLLEKVWKMKPGFCSNPVQTTVCRLRNKVDKDFSHKMIRSIHGVGYSLDLEDNQ